MYITAACLVIVIFRLIYPGEAPPLPYFSKNWRLLRGILDILALFPALILSALVLPFGLIPDSGELYGSFSPKFFHQFNGPITTAICASLMYALVFFLALPVAQAHEENIRYKSGLYRLAKERAQAHMDSGDWLAVMQFIDIAESIWPQAPELENLKIDATIQLDQLRYGDIYQSGDDRPDTPRSNGVAALPGHGESLEVADAIAMGNTALAEERFYDAHWYATLGSRLAPPNSIEQRNANDLAARAWNRISSLEPDSRERERRSLFFLKQSGYRAMVAGDWITAFYIFQELTEKTPNDPDVANFYETSRKGTLGVAFFMDEMELSRGENLIGALFSLPLRGPNGAAGRGVLRFSGLSVTADYAYGTGLEYLSFDSQASPYIQAQAPYAKLLPITIDDQPMVVVLMKALDRRDRERRWDVQWTYAGDGGRQPRDSSIILDVSFEEFLVLFDMRRGLPNLSIAELFSLKDISDAGYIPQALDAEILDRMGAVLLFLPLTVAVLIIGWRFRARS
jgi:hypothetical protein